MLEVQGQHIECQVAEHWGRYQTQELISGKFIWDK